MKLIFSGNAWEDYLYWQKNDEQTFKRVNKLIKDSQRNPCSGIGKTEPLKHALAGYWSRRIDGEHRYVYKPLKDAILIVQLRYHY